VLWKGRYKVPWKKSLTRRLHQSTRRLNQHQIEVHVQKAETADMKNKQMADKALER
jgi:hypothetical protein